MFSALVTVTSLGLDPAAVLTDKARTLIARGGDGAGRDRPLTT